MYILEFQRHAQFSNSFIRAFHPNSTVFFFILIELLGHEDGLYSVVALKEDECPLMSYCDIGFHFLGLVEKTMDNVWAIHGSTEDLYAWRIPQLAYTVSHLL